MTHRIAILGDFNPGYSTHHALNDSIRHVTKRFTEDIQFDWISTDTFNYRTAFTQYYTGLWIAPGSPYKDEPNVINTIKYARENGIPTFGNCGGFQFMIIEYARNVSNIRNADHEESNPNAAEPVISKLSCSLVGLEEQLRIIDKNSRLYQILKKDSLPGKYYCSYGINKKFKDQLFTNGLQATAISADDEIRAFELKGHPFFLGTLFQPALSSDFQQPDMIIEEFVSICLKKK